MFNGCGVLVTDEINNLFVKGLEFLGLALHVLILRVLGGLVSLCDDWHVLISSISLLDWRFLSRCSGTAQEQKGKL